MSIFEQITHHQMDEISTVNQCVKSDRRPEKRDLVSGVILDEAGLPMVLPTVVDCRQQLMRLWAKNQYSTFMPRVSTVDVCGWEHLVGQIISRLQLRREWKWSISRNRQR